MELRNGLLPLFWRRIESTVGEEYRVRTRWRGVSRQRGVLPGHPDRSLKGRVWVRANLPPSHALNLEREHAQKS
jgi:hypothetical protein